MFGLSVAHRRLIWFVGGSLAAACIGGVAAGFVLDLGRRLSAFETPAVLAIGLTMTAVMAVVMGLNLRWWRAVDEATREAHKWSWYWGGTTGLCVGAVLFVLVNSFPRAVDAALDGALSPAHALMAGMAVLAVLQVVGYALFWGGWWLARR